MAVSDVVARPARTAGQLVTATAIVEFVDAVVYDMSDRAYMASIGLLVIVLAWLQVLIENFFGKAVLRKIPEPDAPVVDNAGGGAGG